MRHGPNPEDWQVLVIMALFAVMTFFRTYGFTPPRRCIIDGEPGLNFYSNWNWPARICAIVAVITASAAAILYPW